MSAARPASIPRADVNADLSPATLRLSLSVRLPDRSLAVSPHSRPQAAAPQNPFGCHIWPPCVYGECYPHTYVDASAYRRDITAEQCGAGTPPSGPGSEADVGDKAEINRRAWSEQTSTNPKETVDLRRISEAYSKRRVWRMGILRRLTLHCDPSKLFSFCHDDCRHLLHRPTADEGLFWAFATDFGYYDSNPHRDCRL